MGDNNEPCGIGGGGKFGGIGIELPFILGGGGGGGPKNKSQSYSLSYVWNSKIQKPHLECSKPSALARGEAVECSSSSSSSEAGVEWELKKLPPSFLLSPL